MEQQNENSSQNKLDFAEAETKELSEKYVRKEPTPEMVKLSFYSLLSAAMKYRAMFYENEIKQLKEAPEPSAEDIAKTVPKTQRGKINFKQLVINTRRAQRDNIDHQIKKILSFNKMAHSEIDASRRDAAPKIIENLESISNFIANCTEELLLATDQHEVVMLLSMYNRGDLDILFTEYRAEKQKANAETNPIPAT
jgi:hypothetical protein